MYVLCPITHNCTLLACNQLMSSLFIQCISCNTKNNNNNKYDTAPTNEAFAALPEETLDSLLQPENVDALTDILTYHVVAASAPSSSLSSGDVIETFNGETVTVSISDGGSVMVNDANVINPDIMGSNGIIHVIDKVLIPTPSDGDDGGDDDDEPVVKAGELAEIATVEDDESGSKSDTEWWGGSGWWVAGAGGSKSSKTSYYNKSGKVIAATGWMNPHSIPTGWKPPHSKPHNSHAHHGPHPQAKSVKSVKSAKHVKSAKSSFSWNDAWEGTGDTNDWWAPPSGDSEIMGDDYWWGGAVTPCPPGKAGKDCNIDNIPTMEPTPCGKAGKECEEDPTTETIPDLGDVPVTFVTSTPVGYMDGTTEPPVTAPSPEEESTTATTTGAPTPIEVAATPPGRTGGGGGTTIGDLIPVTVAPISSPPSSGWPTWTPTSTPTSTLKSLEASGTWFQSGRAYEVDASHYRADLKKNGLLVRENGIAFAGDDMVASSSSSGMRGLDCSLSNVVILGGVTVMSFVIMMIQ